MNIYEHPRSLSQINGLEVENCMRLRLGGAKSQTRGCQEQIHWKPGTQLLYGEDIRMRV